MSHAEICKCGHDIATHYKDPRNGRVGRCLGMLCNDCYLYRDANGPKTLPPRPIRHPYTCRCFACTGYPGY